MKILLPLDGSRSWLNTVKYEKDLKNTYGIELLRNYADIHEDFYAIRSEKKIQHPLVQAIIEQ